MRNLLIAAMVFTCTPDILSSILQPSIQQRCIDDLSCPPGDRCLNGQCVFQGQCLSDVDCPIGKKCVNGACR